MSKIEARFASLFNQHFDTTSLEEFKLLLDVNGGLESTTTGIRLKQNGFPTARGLLDPNNGTITLPNAGATPTTVRVGEPFEALDFFVVTSPGTVGSIAVEAGDVLYVNGNSLPPTAGSDYTLSKGAVLGAAVTLKTEVITLTGAQATAGSFALSGIPMKPTETTLSVGGAGGQTYGTDFSVAAGTANITIAPGLLALLAANDELTVQWQ